MKDNYAFSLYECAEELGILYVLSPYGQNIRVSIPLSKKFCEKSIDELALSVRSTNGLMRANLRTVGEVVDAVMTESGLFAVRNLGRKSISEIKTTLLVKAYDELNDRERYVFWCDFAAKNPKPRFEIVGGGEDD